MLHGGSGGGNTYDDSWEWDGAQWQEISVTGASLERTRHTMIYDPSRGGMLTFGGENRFSALLDGDEWLLRDDRWSVASTGDDLPEPRKLHAMAYDAVRGEVVMFGGANNNVGLSSELGDTWVFDGASWRDATPGGGPVARIGHAMAGTPGGIALFGGASGSSASPTYENDLWSVKRISTSRGSTASRSAATVSARTLHSERPT